MAIVNFILRGVSDDNRHPIYVAVETGSVTEMNLLEKITYDDFSYQLECLAKSLEGEEQRIDVLTMALAFGLYRVADEMIKHVNVDASFEDLLRQRLSSGEKEDKSRRRTIRSEQSRYKKKTSFPTPYDDGVSLKRRAFAKRKRKRGPAFVDSGESLQMTKSPSLSAIGKNPPLSPIPASPRSSPIIERLSKNAIPIVTEEAYEVDLNQATPITVLHRTHSSSSSSSTWQRSTSFRALPRTSSSSSGGNSTHLPKKEPIAGTSTTIIPQPPPLPSSPSPLPVKRKDHQSLYTSGPEGEGYVPRSFYQAEVRFHKLSGVETRAAFSRRGFDLSDQMAEGLKHRVKGRRGSESESSSSGTGGEEDDEEIWTTDNDNYEWGHDDGDDDYPSSMESIDDVSYADIGMIGMDDAFDDDGLVLDDHTEATGRDTLLHLAVRDENLSLLRWYLTRHLCDMKQQDQDGNSALHLAIELGFNDGIRALCSIAPYGIDLNQSNRAGNTPLHLAAKANNYEAVEAILHVLADVNMSARNLDGLTPIEVCGDDDIITMIVKDPRYRPLGNPWLKSGMTLLSKLCSMAPDEVGDDLYAKADTLFFDRSIDPLSCHDELVLANSRENFYLVWLILKAGPIGSKDLLLQIRFFSALQVGMEHDSVMQQDRENFFHVFARTGFTAAIYQVLHQSSPDPAGHDIVCATRELLFERVECCKNIYGNHPTMEAAKHNRSDALVLLLQPIINLSMQQNDHEVVSKIHEFLHQSNEKGQTLLYLVSHHHGNLFLPHSMLMHLEYTCHGADSDAIQRCLHECLGSNKMSKKTLHVVKKRTPGPIAKKCKCVGIICVVLLIPLSFFLFDLITDGLLIWEYRLQMHNITYTEQHWEHVARCKSNLTLVCYSLVPDPKSKFTVSLAIILFPFLFYLAEVIKYYRLDLGSRNRELQQKVLNSEVPSPENASLLARIRMSMISWYDAVRIECLSGFTLRRIEKPLRYVTVWLTWPFRVFFMQAISKWKLEQSKDHRKIDQYAEVQRDYQTYSCRAHLIEVCAESSLQPMLQLYLFLPKMVSSFREIGLISTVRLADITSTESLQLMSVMVSVLSVAYSFTTNYRMKKDGAMGMFEPSSLLYFIYALCLVISRLLAFVLFAYHFPPDNWFFPSACVAWHVALMAVIHGANRATWTIYDQPGSSTLKIAVLMYNCIINGLANIFLHSKIDMYAGSHKQAMPEGNHRPSTTSPSRTRARRQSPHPGWWCLCCNTSILSRSKTFVGDGRSTFFRQAFFDIIFGFEIIVMIYIGYCSRLYTDDPEYREAFRIMAVIVFCLFFFGLLIKCVFYLTSHLWSDLIWSDLICSSWISTYSRCSCCCGGGTREESRDNPEELELLTIESHP